MGLSAVLGAVQGGGYISAWKLIVPLLLLLVWSRLLTWVDQDSQEAHLPRVPLNLSFLGGLILAYAMFFAMPNFWLALLVLLALCGGEVGIYLHLRNQRVGLKDLKKDFNAWIYGLTHRDKSGQEQVVEGAVGIFGKGGLLPAPDAESPLRPAYDGVQAALTEPLLKLAEQIDIGPDASGTVAKYIVDGFPYRGAVLDAVSGAAAISYLKSAAGLNVEEVRKPQAATFKVSVAGKKREVRVQTAGTRAGEFMRMIVEPKKRHSERLEEIGLSEAQLEKLTQLIKTDRAGVVLVAIPKGQGLTTTLYAILRAHDAFVEHIHSIERDADADLEGITQNKLAPNATAAEESKMADWIISQEPDVIMISQLESSQTAVELIKYSQNGKRVYVGMRANSTFDALEQWRKLVGDERLATESLRLIISGRVLRKLCAACKAGYAPDPGTLRKLGINPDKVTTLYQARTQPLRDQKGNPIPCDFCHDLRFKGRTGVFETFSIDDEAREVLVGGRSPNQIFRKQRGKYLQEEALALVENGETSVQEVLRVLKGGEGGPAGGKGGEGGAADGGNAVPNPKPSPTRPSARPAAPSGGQVRPKAPVRRPTT